MEELDFRFIKNEFNQLLVATKNLINRDKSLKFWRTENAQILTLNYLQTAELYFLSVVWICENVNIKNLSLSATPQTRAIYEILFILIYLIDDIDNNSLLLSKALHREEIRANKLLEQRYSGKTVWNNFLKEKKETIKKLESSIEIEYSHLLIDAIDWENNNERFPTLKKIKNNFKNSNPDIYEYLQFLDDVWYRELSISSHSETYRIAQISPILAGKDKNLLFELKNKQLWLSVIAVISIISEIEINLKYGLKPKLAYVWTWFTNNSETAKEIYEMRYQNLLNN